MIELNVPWKDYLAILDRRDEIERLTEHTDHNDPVQHKRWCELWDERHA